MITVSGTRSPVSMISADPPAQRGLASTSARSRSPAARCSRPSRVGQPLALSALTRTGRADQQHVHADNPCRSVRERDRQGLPGGPPLPGHGPGRGRTTRGGMDDMELTGWLQGQAFLQTVDEQRGRAGHRVPQRARARLPGAHAERANGGRREATRPRAVTSDRFSIAIQLGGIPAGRGAGADRPVAAGARRRMGAAEPGHARHGSSARPGGPGARSATTRRWVRCAG